MTYAEWEECLKEQKISSAEILDIAKYYDVRKEDNSYLASLQLGKKGAWEVHRIMTAEEWIKEMFDAIGCEKFVLFLKEKYLTDYSTIAKEYLDYLWDKSEDGESVGVYCSSSDRVIFFK